MQLGIGLSLSQYRPVAVDESIPHDADEFFAHTVEQGDFDYPDTATWAAAWAAKFDLLSATSQATIDNTVLSPSGDPTLRVTQDDAGAFWGYKNLDQSYHRLRYRLLFRLSPTFTPINANGESIRFPQLVDSWNDFTFEGGADYVFGNQTWTDDNGNTGTSRVQPLEYLRGVWKSLVVDVDNEDPANASIKIRVGGVLFIDWTGNSGTSTAGLATIGIMAVLRKFDGTADPVNNYINLARYEVVDIEAYPNAHTGLGDIVDPGEPLVEPTYVFPSEVLTPQESTYQFALRVNGVDTAADSWAASAGTIDSDGLFTAPATDGEVTITATLSAVEYTSTVEVSAFNPLTDLASIASSVPVEETTGGVDGETIAFIDDQSGSNNGYGPMFDDQSYNPIYRANQLNGYAAVEGDGAHQMMWTRVDGFAGPIPGGVRTSFAVVRFLSGAKGPATIMALHEGYGRFWRFDLGAQWAWFNLVRNQSYPLGVTARDDRWYLLRVRVNADDSMEAGINGHALVDCGAPSPQLWDSGGVNTRNVILGHSGADEVKSQFADGLDIAAANTDDEERQTRRWFNGKYRIY